MPRQPQPPIPPPPITSQDLADYLSTADDFHLELQTYRACVQYGYTTQYGGTYKDEVTSKPRQFDVRAVLMQRYEAVQLAIECKRLKPSYPLLISQVPRTHDESFHDLAQSYYLTVIRTGDPYAKKLRVSDSGLYRCGHPVGKSTSQISRDGSGKIIKGDQEFYDKWAQALASAHDLVMNSAHRIKAFERQPFVTSLIIPMLVIPDETLWVANYSEDGTLVKTEQAATAMVFVGKEEYHAGADFRYTISHLHVLTFSHFKDTIARIASNIAYWEMLFPPGVVGR